MIRFPHRPLASLSVLALVALVLLLPACSRKADSSEGASPAPAVPAAYAGLRAVYSLTGSSFYATSFSDGKQRLLANAEGDVNPATFATWIPKRAELVYESVQETGRELWVYSENSGEQQRISPKVDAVIGIRAGREVLFASEDPDGPALRAYDLGSGETRTLLAGNVAAVSSADTTAPVCFALKVEGGGQKLYVAEDTGDPRLVVTLPSGREVSRAAVVPEGLVAAVLQPGAGDYGEVTLWDRQTGKPKVLASEARLLDASPGSGVLVQKNLRGGVSGVARSLVAYIPIGAAAASREPQDLGAYVGALHAAAIVGGGGKALVSQRLEGTNRLDLYDLDTGDSVLLGQDQDLQVDRILPLDAASIAAVRTKPGVASGGDEKTGPSILSVEDDLVWIPLEEDAEAVTIVSTTSGPLRLLGLYRAR